MNTGNGSNEAGQTVAIWPQFDEEQINDVVAVLRSGKVNAWTGNKVREFEQAYAALLGRRHAIALANGTVALDVALHAIGLQPGDEVIVTPRSFVASASCVPMAGGVPVFADVDADSQAMTAESIAAVLTPRTRAVIVVHLAGWPADMDAIMRLARQSGIVVIEDCAQAHGAEFERPAGRAFWRHRRLFVLPGQDHHHRRRGRAARHGRRCDLESGVELQGPWQSPRLGERQAGSGWLPLAGRNLRIQLPHDRDRGRHRPQAAAAPALVAWLSEPPTPPF